MRRVVWYNIAPLILGLSACAPAPAPDLERSVEDILEDVLPSPADVDVVDEPEVDVPVAEVVEDVPLGPPLPTCEELEGSAAVGLGHQAGAESRILFEDVTADVGLPEMYTPTVSVGDVNGDGLQDLFVAGWLSEPFYPRQERLERLYSLFIGCAGQFYEYRIDGVYEPLPDELAQPNASHIADMDGDGLVDLVIGHPGAIEVLYQHSAGGFEPVSVWHREDAYYEFRGARRGDLVDLTITDFDGDGMLDIYASHYGGVNPILQGVGNREFRERGFETPAHSEATGRETYASAVIPPVDPSGSPLLYLAHHAEPDQVWRIGEDFNLELVAGGIPTHESMGVDYYYRADDAGIVALVSEWEATHFYLLSNGQVTPLASQPIVQGELPEWGIQFGDFDNNGTPEAVLPTGDRQPYLHDQDYRLHLVVLDETQAEFVPGLGWRDESSTAGAEFDGSKFGNYSALVSVDFDLDGCVDLFVTPMQEFGMNPATLGFSNPVQLLRNRCDYAGDWIGYHLDDPGALISLTLMHEGREVIRRADVQAGSGLGCDGASEQVHFGLGDGAEVRSAELRCSSGEVFPIPSDRRELNAYHSLDDLCVRE